MDHSSKSNIVQQSKWVSIPEDIFSQICLKLEARDLCMLKLSCKEWSKNTPRLYLPKNPLFFSITGDRFLYGDLGQGYMFSVKHQMSFGEIIFCSSAEFLITLVAKNGQIWVLNVLTSTLEALPEPPKEMKTTHAISWRMPGSSFGMFAITEGGIEVSISLYCQSMGWLSRTYDCQRPFCLSEESAPLKRGNYVYCLGINCELAVFDLENRDWIVQAATISLPMYSYEDCYLLASHLGLLAIIMNKSYMSFPRVLKLDIRKRNWNQLRSLNGIVIFSGCPTSVSVKDQISSIKNKVFLPHASGNYDLIEALVKSHEGKLIFAVESHNVPDSRGYNRLKLDWWLLDENNIIRTRPGVPCKKRKRDSSTHGQELPIGTFLEIKVLSNHDHKLQTVAGPSQRPEP